MQLYLLYLSKNLFRLKEFDKSLNSLALPLKVPLKNNEL